MWDVLEAFNRLILYSPCKNWKQNAKEAIDIFMGQKKSTVDVFFYVKTVREKYKNNNVR